MSTPLVDRVPFAKIVTVLAIAFGVSLGLCGLNQVLVSGGAGERSTVGDQLLTIGAILEFVVMALSSVGLVLTCIAWVVLSAIGAFRQQDQEPQRLFDKIADEDDSRKDRND